MTKNNDLEYFHYAYTTYDFNTSESKILRHLKSFAYDKEISKGYHGNLHLHPDIVCSTKEEAIQAIEDIVQYPYDDHGVLFLDSHGRKTWLVKSTWKMA